MFDILQHLKYIQVNVLFTNRKGEKRINIVQKLIKNFFLALLSGGHIQFEFHASKQDIK